MRLVQGRVESAWARAQRKRREMNGASAKTTMGTVRRSDARRRGTLSVREGAYLQRVGYEVLEAADGLEGLELFREHRDQLNVIVTDIVMPRLDGWGLVSEDRNSAHAL